MAHQAIGIGGVVGFIGATVIDIATGGAALAFGINPLSGAAVGMAAGAKIQGAIAAGDEARTEKAAVGTGPSDTSGVDTKSGDQTTTIDGQTVQTQYALAEQTVQQQQAQTEAAKARGEQQIGALMVTEGRQESAIRAAAAARGFTVGGGTAGEQLRAQQERGATAIGGARQELSSSLAEQAAVTETGYQSFRHAAAMKDYAATQAANNAWLTAFSGSAKEGGSLLDKWKPDLLGSGGAGSGYQYQPGYGWGYGGY